MRVRGQLAEAGHAAAQLVDVLHAEVHTGLVGYGQKVEHGVGGAAHGDVERHGVEESLAGGDGAGEHAFVALFVVLQRVRHDEACGILEEAEAVGVGGENGAVAGQRESECFSEAVHGVGREHARAGAAAGTGAGFDFGQFAVADGGVGTFHHGAHEVHVLALVVAGFHGAAAHEHRGDVQPHGRHEHARRNLVAVGDADERVGLVGLYHILHAVGDDVARGQGVEHAVVSHGDAVVDGDGVELGSVAAQLFDFAFHVLSYFVEVRVSRNELGKRVGNRYDGFAYLFALHAGGHPEGPGAGHASSFCAESTAQGFLHNSWYLGIDSHEGRWQRQIFVLFLLRRRCRA